MIAVRTIYLLALALLSLAGCAGGAHSLIADAASPFVSGQLLRDGQSDQLILATGTRTYRGSLHVERTQDWKALAERYRASPKQWDRIFSGLDARHIVYRGKAHLTDEDGDPLECELAWRSGTSPGGRCMTNAGTTISVKFE